MIVHLISNPRILSLTPCESFRQMLTSPACNLLLFFLREWMEGPLGVVDPDYVEQETGNFWRSLYKSEKQFNEVPTAQKIAKKVRYIIDIHWLFNKLFFVFSIWCYYWQGDEET